MPLKEVNLDGMTELESLEPLRGAAIESLDIRQCYKVTDISMLAEMPLKRLAIASDSDLDLSCLQGKTLEYLSISLPFRDIDFLETMKVSHLELFAGNLRNISGLASQAGSLKRLNLQGGSNKILTDLSPLRDLRLDYINIEGFIIPDISPLKEMKLKEARILLPHLHDVNALRDMPLEKVTFGGGISNISALGRNDRLTTVYLGGCQDLRDFRTLGTLVNLQRVIFPESAREADLDFLREHRKLQEAGYIDDYGPIADFWKERDGQ